MEWQKIETAPRDGTKILAYASMDFTVVYWNKYVEEWILSECGLHAEDGRWWPTHWMPLPTPPIEQN